MFGTDLPGKILELFNYGPCERLSQNTSKNFKTHENRILHIFPFVTNNIMSCKNREILLPRPQIFSYSWTEIMLIPNLPPEISLLEQDRCLNLIKLITIYLSEHCFPLRSWKWDDMSHHRIRPSSCTSRNRSSSSYENNTRSIICTLLLNLSFVVFDNLVRSTLAVQGRREDSSNVESCGCAQDICFA